MIALLRRLIRRARGPRVKLEMSGRCGELLYLEADRHVAVYVEISGVPEYDLLVSSGGLKRWADGRPLSAEERATVQAALRKWARSSGTRCQW